MTSTALTHFPARATQATCTMPIGGVVPPCAGKPAWKWSDPRLEMCALSAWRTSSSSTEGGLKLRDRPFLLPKDAQGGQTVTQSFLNNI